MLIRREQPADADVVETIHRDAFGGEVEPALAVSLRSDGACPEFSFVAERDGLVVGHVVCSRGSIVRPSAADEDVPALGLGPIGVSPELQGDGVGSALMHAVLGAADAAGEPLVALLGNPGFYRRFGFVASTSVGIDPPDAAWGEFFQVRPLTTFSPDLAGAFVYAAPFQSL